MRRPVILLALFAPALILLFFWLRPDIDPTFRLPLLHFYIVTFTSLAATVVSFLLVAALGSVARPRHVLGAVAFAIMGSLFSVHGLTTPGALIPATHPAVPAVSLSSWLTLFSGGVVFALAALDRPRVRSQRFLLRFVFAAAVGIMLFIAVVVVAPQLLGMLEDGAAPWHRRVLFFFSFAVWALAAVHLFRTWQETRNHIDGALALVAGLLAQATISMHLFPLWNLSWWMYHFVLLGSFLLTTYVLFTTYEQARTFRLSRYYLAASSILTALLALVASFLFSQFATGAFTDEIARDTVTTLETFIADTAGQIAPGSSTDEVHRLFAGRLGVVPADAAAVYDLEGHRLFSHNSDSSYYAVGSHGPLWQRVLRGETVVNIVPPTAQNGNGEGYGATEASDHYVAYGYQALGSSAEPSGVLVTETALPRLAGAIMRARTMGLLIAAATMGSLFMMMWLVVRRADGIIVSRNKELALAYRDLREAETMRDDLTHMIVHDLRTPLTAILTSLGLLERIPAETRAIHQNRIIERTRYAAERLDKMIDDILLVSKIEKGELELHKQTVSVANLLSQQLDPYYLQATAEEKTLELECPSELQASLDPRLTGRVVENLVSNAFKYTKPGGRIRVMARNRNGTVAMSVSDDGEGVPDTYKEAIFRKFSQAPPGHADQTRKGTGLGLAFCRLAIEAHGGKIWVVDAPGGGSEFRIELPREDSLQQRQYETTSEDTAP